MNESTLRAAGIDYDGALTRFMGKREIYERYLLKYLNDDHAQAAKEAFLRSDYKEVLDQTHALKGLSGTLGLTKVFEISSQIVKDLRGGCYDMLGENMELLEDAQQQMCRVIQNA